MSETLISSTPAHGAVGSVGFGFGVWREGVRETKTKKIFKYGSLPTNCFSCLVCFILILAIACSELEIMALSRNPEKTRPDKVTMPYPYHGPWRLFAMGAAFRNWVWVFLECVYSLKDSKFVNKT